MAPTATADPSVRLYFRSTLSRSEIIEKYRTIRATTEALTEPLETEDYVVQSMPDASPTKWHLAHTTWFFDTFVLPAVLPDWVSDFPEYGYLFNSYYVQAGERYPRPLRGLVTRPTVAQAFEYRRAIDEKLLRMLHETDDRTIALATPLVELGLHHEQQHQELMVTDLKHLLSFNPLHPVYREQAASSRAISDPAPLGWVPFSEAIQTIGHRKDGFCFDNELPSHRVLVGNFELADRLVTNGEYLEFMGDGGYGTATLWLNEGWQTVVEQGWQAPLYWKPVDGTWQQFTLSGLRPVDPLEPVCHVSHFEADAFARWAGARLPTEQEWEVAATAAPIQGNLLDHFWFHPQALGSRDGNGVQQLYGDVWEWTQSPYVGYPGYRPMSGALGEYNGKFMSRQIVLRGGSCATPGSHIRPSYRNFFSPTARWQFSGIRLCRDGNRGVAS